VTDPFDVDQNIRGGLQYLKNLLDRLGRLERALWAYNAGPRAVWEGRLPAETMSYINRVLFVRSYLNGQRRRGREGEGVSLPFSPSPPLSLSPEGG